MISWVKLVFPLTVKHDYLTGHVLWSLYEWRLAWVCESQENLPGWFKKSQKVSNKTKSCHKCHLRTTHSFAPLQLICFLPLAVGWTLQSPISGPQTSLSGKWEEENKKSVGFASGHQTHKKGTLPMKIVEKNCSCSHITKLKLLDWHQIHWHRNDQISPNLVFVLPDFTGKEPKVITFQVYILGLYRNVTFKHTATN